MIKTIIFDLDGVLIESKEIHFKALNQALPFNYRISYEEHLSTYDGLPTREKLKLLTQYKDLPEDLYEEIAKNKAKETQNVLFDTIQPRMEFTKIFMCLKNAGYRIALASNAVRSTVDTALDCLELRKYFDVIYSNQEVERPKPHFEMYFKIMMDMNSKPSETLILEDSHIGRQAVLDAGCHLLPIIDTYDVKLEKIEAKLAELNKQIIVRVPWRSNKMNVLIPMAGAGSRFADAGYTFPKPLIEVGNKPMIQVVTDNLNIDAHHIYIVQKEHYEKYNLKYLLNLITNNNCEIVQVDGITEGAACTTLLAKQFIDNDEPLIIANSDQHVEWESNEFMYAMAADNISGGIVTFEATHPKWSFAKLDEDGFVSEVAEKKPISNNATVGIYYWQKGKDYVNYAEEMIEKDIRTNGEFYVCPVYNQAIEHGDKIKMFPIEKMWGLGTPEDLKRYLNDSNIT